MPTIYKTDGTQTPIQPKSKYFSLKELQGIVGGCIEQIYLHDGKIMIVNEEGKLDNLPLNVRATEIIRKQDIFDVIVGDVLLTESKYFK